PRNGLVYGVGNSNSGAAISARLFIRNDDETTDLTATTNVSVGPPQPPTPGDGGDGGNGGDCSLIDQLLGNC
ncbi:MAG: hypothetical protein R3268_09740, partial [Acidiferrobacterales bacterium]|nr:hypothetical protein [Acidiferrobacterales bacterium]